MMDPGRIEAIHKSEEVMFMQTPHFITVICDIYKISVYNFIENPYFSPAWIPYTIAVKDSGLPGSYTVQQG
jgi:hypothetical protein